MLHSTATIIHSRTGLPAPFPPIRSKSFNPAFNTSRKVARASIPAFYADKTQASPQLGGENRLFRRVTPRPRQSVT